MPYMAILSLDLLIGILLVYDVPMRFAKANQHFLQLIQHRLLFSITCLTQIETRHVGCELVNFAHAAS